MTMDDDGASAYADTPELDDGAWAAPVQPKRRRLIDGPLRHTFRTLRDAYRTRCAAAQLPCAICGKPIDYRLTHGDPWAFELDHVIPVEDDENLALVESNWQPSHSRCNKRKGILAAMDREAGGAGKRDPMDESTWPTAVVKGQLVRYNPELGVPTEIW